MDPLGTSVKVLPLGGPWCPSWGETFTVKLLTPNRKLLLEACPLWDVSSGHCGPPRCCCLSSEEAVCVQISVLLRSERALPPSLSSPPLVPMSLVQRWYCCPPGQLPQLHFISRASRARSKVLEKKRPSALDTGGAFAPVGKQKLVIKLFLQVQA